MSLDKDVNINNSFNITLENTSQVVHRVAMFELGSDDPNSLTSTGCAIASQPNSVHQFWTMDSGSGTYPFV